MVNLLWHDSWFPLPIDVMVLVGYYVAVNSANKGQIKFCLVIGVNCLKLKTLNRATLLCCFFSPETSEKHNEILLNPGQEESEFC